MAPYGLSNRGWETAGGGQWNAGQVSDPVNDWSYNQNYSGKIPEGAQTFDPNAPDPRIADLRGRCMGGDRDACQQLSSIEQNAADKRGNWGGNQGGGGQGTLGQYGGGGGGGGGGQTFGWGGNVNFPGSTTTIGQPGGPDPRQGGGRMQPQDQAQPWGNGGATDPYQGGGWGGQTDPMQGGWGGTRPSMAGRMLGSMFGQRR